MCTTQHFYPRSPCGERHCCRKHGKQGTEISIHALLAESDRHWACPDGSARLFLSTLSLRRATLRVLDGSKSSIISIHALLAESDPLVVTAFPGSVDNFYPRSPCGERLKQSDERFKTQVFLSTLSLRRATVSITITITCIVSFLSTLSLRRATAKVHKTVGHFCAYETNFMGIASSC